MKKTDNTLLDKTRVNGFVYDDAVKSKFRNATKTLADMTIVTVDSVYKFLSKFDPPDEATGYIGFQPFTASVNPADWKLNFMHNLHQKKIIDNMIFAIFLKFQKNDDETTSHIKIGGYDPNVIKSGHSIDFLRTIDAKSWSLPLNNLIVGKQNNALNDGQRLEFFPNFPFVYLPESDFNVFKENIKKIYPDVMTNGVNTNLYFNYSCRAIDHTINSDI